MALSQARGLNAAVAIYRYFPVRRCRLIIAYTFDFKRSQFFSRFKKKYDQVQKLIRPWPDQPDRFCRACNIQISIIFGRVLKRAVELIGKRCLLWHVKSLMETITYHCRTRKIRQVIIKNEYCPNLRKKETKHW